MNADGACPEFPLSESVVLQAGASRARLLPAAGGRVTALRLVPLGSDAAVEVLHPYSEDFFDPLRWGKGGIYPLMPYSNRIAQALLQVDGEAVALLAHPDAAPHTLHGNAHALPWTVLAQSANHVVMVVEAAASAAWPWRYTGRMGLHLSPSALSVSVSVCNGDDRRMPAGLGLHPYFRHGPEARVGYRARSIWPPTSDFLATQARAPTPDENHLPARAMRAGGLTDYVGAWDGLASVELPEGDWLEIHADAVFGHLVVHRPDSLAYLCLEPVSHVADGFNLAARGVPDTGTRWLAPGESLVGQILFSLRKAPV